MSPTLPLYVLLLAGLLHLHAAEASSSTLGRIDALAPAHVELLERAGVRSIAALAALDPDRLAGMLDTDHASAVAITLESRAMHQALQRTFEQALARHRAEGVRLPDPATSEFARLIEPTNECTLLVRQVCGIGHECEGRVGCNSALELLSIFNSGGPYTEDVAEACLLSLSDSGSFPMCTL